MKPWASCPGLKSSFFRLYGSGAGPQIKGLGVKARSWGTSTILPVPSADGAQRAGLPSGDAIACLAALALSMGCYGDSWGWRNEGLFGAEVENPTSSTAMLGAGSSPGHCCVGSQSREATASIALRVPSALSQEAEHLCLSWGWRLPSVSLLYF